MAEGEKSQDLAGGRIDRGLYVGRNVSGARMWLEVGETGESMVEECIRSQDVVGGRRGRDLYGGGNV